MSTADHLKHRWQDWTGDDESPLEGDTPAWIVSFLVHFGVLVALAILCQYRPKQEQTLTVTPLDTQEVEQVTENLTNFENDQTMEVGAASLAGSESAMAMAESLAEESMISSEALTSDSTEVQVPVLEDLSSAPLVSESLVVKGSAGVGTTGAEGAVDRLTEEIAESLEDRRTLIVWVLDQSLSMQPQRKAIVDRLDRIYKELGIADQRDSYSGRNNAPLLASVVAFGKTVSFRTPEPTDDVEEIKQAINSIENDPSGVEATFTAVGMVAKKFQNFRTQAPRRNVMIIVFSDEVGDDAEQQMDNTLSLCRRYEMPVYVVGIPAPFARRDIEVRYVDPDPKFDQTARWIPVRQGPESLFPEGVQLAFAQGNEDLNHLDSGFGPFALTRLCFETGGIYFTVHPNRSSTGRRHSEVANMSARLDHFFDSTIMRTYQPDYVSVKEYEQKLAHNKARSALVQAARESQIQPMDNPRLEFPKTDEAGFKRTLDEAQKDAAKLGPKVDRLYQILKDGEKDRGKLTEPRWQAGYDLAMGRVLAVKVRTEAYNAMLAKAKGGLKFQNPDSDTFVLEPANDISVGSAVEKMAKQAREYLSRVVQQHEGTPWALLAERELKDPIGWKWGEKSLKLEQQRRMAAGNGNNAPNKDALKKLEKPKPKREDVKL
ncbi:MAG TPA: vWA domain-containing protein [Pirellulales bacterium]|nr:vWA domain-containing protein [Pirellulales bacterium]